MDIKSGIIGLIAVVALAISGFTSVKEEAPVEITNLGALSSPDLPRDISIGGAKIRGSRVSPLQTSTTTVAAILSPVSTSTLVSAACRFSTSSTTASTITMAKDSDGNGSSTPLQSFSVSANAQADISLPATTTTAGMSNLTFGPSTYLTVTMAGNTGTFSPVGSCEAVWLQN